MPQVDRFPVLPTLAPGRDAFALLVVVLATE